jgi:biopolymer transport protein TolQ
VTGPIGILDLVLASSTVAKFILIVLFAFSVVSWAIIAERWRLFRRARAQSRRFFDAFRTQPDYRQVYQAAARWPDSPAANVFRTVYNKHAALLTPQKIGQHNPETMLEVVYRELDRAGHAELSRFERRLSLLATASSVGPFLGLLGTVWGVMISFLNISAQGATNIVVVAPGIAEALIATVAGLAVAIPATVAYNYFLHQTRQFGLELEDVATMLLNTLQTRDRHESV